MKKEGGAISGGSYAEYAHMDELLTLQHPLTGAVAEPGFIILSQVKELLFKLLHIEFTAARDYLHDTRLDEALWTLRRSSRVQQVLLSCWEPLSVLAPGEFAAFRDTISHASGFQSRSYRLLEFLLGNKDPRLAEPHRGTPHHAAVLDQLRKPSLYDEALRHLSRHCLGIPSAVLDRDFSLPYEPHEAVRQAWHTVYAQPARYQELFLLAEALTDTAYLFARWRYAHLLTVERLLGNKPGTGGTTGVPWLTGVAQHRFFPELWSVRSAL